MRDSEQLKVITASAAAIARSYCEQSKIVQSLLLLRPCPSALELGFAWAACVVDLKRTIGKRRTDRAQVQYATARNLFDAACVSSLNPVLMTENFDLRLIGMEQLVSEPVRKGKFPCSKDLLSMVALLATHTTKASLLLVDLAFMGMTVDEVAVAASSAIKAIAKRTDLNFFEATRTRKLIAATPWSIAPNPHL